MPTAPTRRATPTCPPARCSARPAWTRLYLHALREADRLGLEISLNIASGWNLGGPDVTPEQASKLLTWSRATATGSTLDLKLPEPASKNGFYRQIAVLAYPLRHGATLAGEKGDPRAAITRLPERSASVETGFSMPDSTWMLDPGKATPGEADTSLGQVIDISEHVLADGTVHWAAPSDGTWEILRIGYTDSDARVSTSSGAWQGLAIDYLDHNAFDTYWSRNVDPLMIAAKPYLGHSLKYLVTDSWELKGTNWTPAFRAKFLELRGYDPVPYLPVLAGRIVESRDVSTRFLSDLRRTVADLVVTEHYDVFAKHAAQYGLGIHPESGGPHGAPIDALETFRSDALVQTEYWAPNAHRSTDEERFYPKEAASAAHIYGKQIIAMEGMTSIGPQWSEHLSSDLKPAFDQAITEGMNRLIWHEFTSSPANTGLPGQEYFAGTHLNPKVTWWKAARPFFTYLNRAQFIAQQGVAVDDVLYFYGDNIPAFVRVKADNPAKVPDGYDYDVINEDALLHNLKTEHGTLQGPVSMSWKLLVLPMSGRLSLAALQAIGHLVEAGASISGERPLSPTGNVTTQARSDFDTLAQTMWGDCRRGEKRAYGSGSIFCSADTGAALSAMKLKQDFSSDDGSLDFIHRRVGDTDVYFVRSRTGKAIDTNVVLRAEGRAPQIWDGVTGEMEVNPMYTRAEDGMIRMRLDLPAYGSAYIVCNGHSALPKEQAEHRLVETPVHGPWTVTFEAGRGAPEGPVPFTKMTSWSDSPDERIRFFSGTATYKSSFTAPKGRYVILHIPQVREIAKVTINGHDAGTLWAEPYELHIESLLHPGENTIEIEVTNLWPNRIIGDAQPNVTKKYTNTNIHHYKADSPLLPSGLIGEVVLMH